MKLKQEKILYPVQNSFKILKYAVPYFDMPFHYHPEYELVYITKGSGLRYIGRSIHKFKNGDMVLIGPDLAHIWINPNKYRQKKFNLGAEAIVLQFSKDLFRSMIDAPEFVLIKNLLSNTQVGLNIMGKARESVADILDKLLVCEGIDRLINLIKILDLLSKDKQLIALNPPDYTPQPHQADERVNAVHHFVMSCYHQKITIKDASSIANMEESAFCRFFKLKTQKTFTQFLNETRVDRACRLLLERNLSISQVAYESGFNNMTNFYRQFKKNTGVTPGEYKG